MAKTQPPLGQGCVGGWPPAVGQLRKTVGGQPRAKRHKAVGVFASYDESVEERSRRLATSLFDTVGDRRFYILQTGDSLATPPYPIAIDRKMQFSARNVIATIPPTKLSRLEVFEKASAQITSLCQNGKAVASQTLSDIAENTLPSDMKTIPVYWGDSSSGRGFLIHGGEASDTIILPVGTSPPESSVFIAGTEQQVKLEKVDLMT